ncbi:MAG: hypothetical protein FJX23_02770 [Alphaproteobacteria bacterium]|nr:hypothetical protein [Alphaproteobacteria bacterium]
MKRSHLLLLIIFLEGYVVLAAELLCMRLLVPFVGSGTEIIAIIISAVLLPLAFGYHWGGTYGARRREQRRLDPHSRHKTIRNALVRNLTVALLIFTFGLSYVVHELLFGAMHAIGISHIVVQTTIFCLLFLVYPTFILGQTVPLISHYFAKKELSQITGRMLCFSTTGSFFGSVFTTIVLMMTIGVHNTVILVLGFITFMIFILDRKLFTFKHLLVLLVFGLGILLNNSDTMRSLDVVSNNAYNLIQVHDKPNGDRVFGVNRSYSSIYSKEGRKFPYIQYIEDHYLKHIEGQNKKILVIGAGGFTLGLEDTTNLYTFIDIDPAIKDVAEKHFLPENLTPNKKFEPQSARSYLAHNTEQFDFILVDAYSNEISIPMECTTKEFFEEVKKSLKPGGMVVANIISRPDMSDKFSIRIVNTFASVFPRFNRFGFLDYNPWTSEVLPEGRKETDPPLYYDNVMLTYFDNELSQDTTIYTDDKTTYSLDKKRYSK